MIRILIAISLILTALTLDMSSAKRRVSTSAYVALYTSLGLKTGYKELSKTALNSNYYTMTYDIKVKNEQGNDIEIGKGEFPKFDTETSGVLAFQYEEDLSKFPEWLKSSCKDNFCRLDNAIFFNYYTTPDYIKIIFLKDDKKHTVFLYLTNLTDNPLPDEMDFLYPRSLVKNQIENFNQLLSTFNKRYFDLLTSISAKTVTVVEYLEEIKMKILKATDAEARKKHRDNLLAQLGKLRDQKQKIEIQITHSNQNINIFTLSIQSLSSDNKKCEEEMQNLTKDIESEKIIINTNKDLIQKQIKKLSLERETCIAKLYYNFEAAYFYRVFSEKIVKTQAEMTIAVDAKNIETTKTKISKAFFPINVKFASAKVK
jgi:hypothetical protein